MDIRAFNYSFEVQNITSPILLEEDVGLNNTDVLLHIGAVSNKTTNLPSFVKAPIQNGTLDGNENTKILGFANFVYKDIAMRWYKELTSLGYTNHYVVASDNETAQYFHEHQMRYDYLNTERKGWLWGKDTCPNKTAAMRPGQISQNIRRSMFGSRWFYILNQLKLGYNILITDVDNLFQKYKSMHDFEEEEYDMVHAFCGEINAFPQYVYNRLGFTICGGMSWIRSSKSVLEFVSELARRCGCLEEIGCDCFCDDQVAINRMYLEGPFKAIWNQKPHQKVIAMTIEDIYWDGFDGVCPITGHKIKILDRNMAWRGTLREDMKCPNNTWVAMPQGQKDKYKTRELWNQYCKTELSYDNTTR